MKMKPRITHRFKVTPKAAAGLQEELKCRLETGRPLDINRVKYVAGADVSYLRGDERMFAAVSVFTYPDMEPVESRWGSTPVGFRHREPHGSAAGRSDRRGREIGSGRGV